MIVFFDTETVGLPKNYKAAINDTSNWPMITQFGYQAYSESGALLHEHQTLVCPPDGIAFPISEEASKVTGITDAICVEKGEPIANAMKDFVAVVNDAKLLVAHNLGFDRPVMTCEMLRSGQRPVPNPERRFLCTMLATVDFCKIIGPYGFKWPKLIELHNHLFGCDFDGAHDALVDVSATAKCYFELVNRGFDFEKFKVK